MLRSPLVILFIAIIGLVVVFFWFRRDIGNVVSVARELLKEIDDKYTSFIKKRIRLSVLEDRSIEDEREEIIEEAMTVLQPEINELIAHINASMAGGLKTNHKSPYFRSAVSTVNHLFTKSGKNPDKALTIEDIEQLNEAFRTGIASDLTQRILDLKTGANL